MVASDSNAGTFEIDLSILDREFSWSARHDTKETIRKIKEAQVRLSGWLKRAVRCWKPESHAACFSFGLRVELPLFISEP